ncbi:MAG TPA: response regulator transcription factor [Bacteroidia bacterium]|nr:response regulator transcription factor [Bacteroidia bacterium]
MTEETETTRVLLAEDDPNLGKLLQEYLDAKGFETVLAINGKDAFEQFRKNNFDLCLLDVMMPIKDGYTLAKEIRTVNREIPIVFLTAKSMKEDTIEGFTAGADDYITKPFSMEELMLRLKAILRRTKGGKLDMEQTQFTIGDYKFDYTRQMLEFGDKSQKLTSKEADLLRILALHKNEVLDRSFALNTIWGDDSYFNSRSMDVYIAKLRKYLKEDPTVEIMNIHGRGFRLIAK